jgi:hypothetical protein
MWLGKADPVKSMDLARAEDPELGALRAMLAAWTEEIGIGGTYRKTLQQVIDMIGLTQSNSFGAAELVHPQLHAAVHAVAGGRGPPDAKRLGNWARGRKNRLVDNLRLAAKADPKGGSEWWVEHKDGTESPAGRDTKPI